MRHAERPLAMLRNPSRSAVAKKLAVFQPNISHLERNTDPKASKVASYVDALGGRLKVWAVVDGETATL